MPLESSAVRSLVLNLPADRSMRPSLGFFLVLMLVTLALAGATGARALSLGEWLRALLTNPWQIDPGTTPDAFLLWQLRLPRILLAALVGAGLAVSGCVLQALFRNPLADPGLIGVSMGAAVGAVAWIVLGAALFGGALSPTWQLYSLPFAAFLGALGIALLALFMAHRAGEVDTASLLLTGVALNALASALIGVMVFMADDRQLRDLTFWTMGSLSGSHWGLLLPGVFLILGPGAWILTQGWALDRLSIGEREAFYLGVDVARTKLCLLVATAVVVGTAVASVGAIGFVGLLIPHLARLAVGASHRLLLPVTACLGVVLVAGADAVARVVVLPAELPVGLLTALFGAPCLLILLWQRERRGGS